MIREDDGDPTEDGTPVAPSSEPAAPTPAAARWWGPKSKRPAILVCTAITLHALHMLGPAPLDVLAVLGVWVTAAAALTYRDYRAAHVTLLAALLTLPRVVPALADWPLHLLVPSAGYALLLLVLPRPPALRWLRRGAFDARTMGLVLLIFMVSAGGLVGWLVVVAPDVSDLTADLPAWPLHLLVVLGLGFALLNAALEEAIWRGVMLAGLDATTGWPSFAVVVQAASFGVVHANTFPRGGLGVAMAFVYGLMLGALRLRARGMLAPFLAHVGTDVIVFGLLLWSVHR